MRERCNVVVFASWHFCLIFQMFFFGVSYTQEDNLFNFGEKQYASSLVEAVSSHPARLPCNMTTSPPDNVTLVLWFKKGIATPIYSYDMRNLEGGEPKHWYDSAVFGSNPFFSANSNPPHLLLRHLTVDDAGLYKCRVDFISEPTRNSRVNLTVVVPPRDVVIKNSEGKEVISYIGPVSEGDDLFLSCIADGGIPPPVLIWYQNDEIIDKEANSHRQMEVQNDLKIKNLTRKHLRAQMECRATYKDVYPPLITTTTIDMNLEPLDVKIHSSRDPLSSGKSYEIVCSSRGSRPPAVLKWFIGDRRIPTVADETSSDGNMTKSILHLNINSSYNEKRLSCRAENKKIPAVIVEDTWTFRVFYVPIVSVRLGSSLDLSSINEGADVFFECEVKSNPPLYKVTWRHNDEIVNHNISSGVIISNRSLVLQDIKRTAAGRYSCVASNVEGDGKSRPLELKIQYIPVCKANQTKIYGVSKLEKAHVTCQVDAVPQATKFSWRFNNTAESIKVPDHKATVGFGGRSVVSYIPVSDLDYGTLLCSAENVVGKQEVPCVFHIISASPPAQPEAPINCSVHNVSANSLEVSCQEGFDGGLQQLFVMEVYTTHPHMLHSNKTASKPKFKVSGLESDTAIQLIIYSGNEKGRSGITRLVTDTLKPPVKQLETRVGTGDKANPSLNFPSAMPSIVGSLAAGAFVLICIIITITISVRRKCCWKRRGGEETVNVSSECSQTHLSSEMKFTEGPHSPLTQTFADSLQPLQIRHGNHCQQQQQQQQQQQKQQQQMHPQQLHSHHYHSQPHDFKALQCPELHYQPLRQPPLRIDEECARDIPPPSQYATESKNRGHSEQILSANLSVATQNHHDHLLTLPLKTRGNTSYSPFRTDPVDTRVSSSGVFTWSPKTDGITAHSSSIEDSRVPLVCVVNGSSSSQKQNCGSLTALTSISDDCESPFSAASRKESAL